VLSVILTITGSLYAVLTVIVTIMKITGGGLYAMLTVIVTLTRSYICSANSYCDNKGEVNAQS
jgi:hypothetical protein